MAANQLTHTGGWTPDREKALRSLWNDGKSASQIAAIMGGGLSRSGVLGKAHRLKLASRTKAASKPAPRRLKRVGNAGGTVAKLKKARDVAPQAASVAEALRAVTVSDPSGDKYLKSAVWSPLPGTEPIGLLQLNEHTCRWPVGAAPTLFCGLNPNAGSPYCALHAARSVRRLG